MPLLSLTIPNIAKPPLTQGTFEAGKLRFTLANFLLFAERIMCVKAALRNDGVT